MNQFCKRYGVHKTTVLLLMVLGLVLTAHAFDEAGILSDNQNSTQESTHETYSQPDGSPSQLVQLSSALNSTKLWFETSVSYFRSHASNGMRIATANAAAVYAFVSEDAMASASSIGMNTIVYMQGTAAKLSDVLNPGKSVIQSHSFSLSVIGLVTVFGVVLMR